MRKIVNRYFKNKMYDFGKKEVVFSLNLIIYVENKGFNFIQTFVQFK